MSLCDKYHNLCALAHYEFAEYGHIYALRPYCCCVVAKLWMTHYFGCWIRMVYTFANPGEMLQSVASNLGLRRLSMLQLFDTICFEMGF